MKWGLRILPNKENEQANQELKILEEYVISASDFLRKNKETFFKGKKNIPIYLILGPSRFGKTTILSQSGLDLIDSKKQTFDYVIPTKYCTFWFTSDAIYIDTAGNYTKPDVTKPRNDIIWQGFIKLLQKYFGKDSIKGVLIILDLPAISQDKNLLNKTLFCIRERIYELATLIQDLHTHIIFTKCDRISGFAEFFSSLDPKERQEPFGISFLSDKEIDLVTNFEIKFNKLLENLNNRIIENLQKSIKSKDRPLIKIFPSQLEHLRQTFIDVISKIPNGSQIILSGIYFTSSIQDGASINPIENTITQTLHLKEKQGYHLEANDNCSYFIEDLFRKGVTPPPKQKKKDEINLPYLQLKYIYAAIIAGLIITISAIVGYKSYHKNLYTLKKAKESILNQDINNHNNLHKIIKQIEPNSKSLWLTLGINKIKPLYNSLTKTHQTLLVQKLTSKLENYLEETFESEEPEKTQKLYKALKAYIMFSDYKKLDPEYVKAWFGNYWKPTKTKKEITNLRKQLDTIFKHKFKTELNQQLLDTIRYNLKNLPPIKQTYLLLEKRYINKNLSIDNKRSISKIYTKENFNKVYKNRIPDLINNPPKNDQILGDLEIQFENDKNDTIEELRKLYIKKYVSAWENELKIEAKKEFKDIKEAGDYLSNISSSNTYLLNILKLIKKNTDIKNPPERFKEELDIKLNGLDNINISSLQKNLKQLTKYIKSISQSPYPNEATFNKIIQQLQDDSINPVASLKNSIEDQPAWLKTYLNNITENIWQLLMKSMHAYINDAWNQKIIPEYKENLVNKYPIFKKSKKEVGIEDFSKFFGPDGTIDGFFKKYIEPLVNTKKTDWKWKKIAGQEINFSPDFLEVFLRASMIKKMFFASNDTLMPKIRFSLIPAAMTPSTQSFSLHIDGQKISFANNKNKKTNHLIWPGPQPGSITISFVNTKGKYFTTSEFGDWAWFRVLDKSNISSGKNTRRFKLAFNLNGNTAKYTLSTPDPVNPFIPNVINNFRCVEKLD